MTTDKQAVERQEAFNRYSHLAQDALRQWVGDQFTSRDIHAWCQGYAVALASLTQPKADDNSLGALSGSKASPEAPAGYDPARWQPIETAPRGEREYFLAWDGREIHFAHQWGGHCWSVNNRDSHNGDELGVDATHWIPLPSPRRQQETEDG